MRNEPGIKHVNIIIGALAFLTVAIHLIFSYNLEFHRDELLYFSLGQHPAFGYATVPPLTGWVAWGRKIFSDILYLQSGFFPHYWAG